MVTAIAGNQYDIGLALQSAQGSAASASQFRLYVMAGGLMPTKGTEDIAETSSGRLRNEAFVTRVAAEGSPQFVARPRGIGLLMYGAMGAKAVAGAGDPYTHTFTLGSTLPYLTAWSRLGSLSSGGQYYKYADVKVGQLVLASQAGGLLTCTATLMGLQPSFLAAAETTVAPEATTGTAFVHADGSGALLVEGAAVSTIEQCEVSIGNSGAIQQGDSVTGYAVTEAMNEVFIRTTELVQDFALWNRFLFSDSTPAGADVPTRDVLELAGSPAGIDFKWTRPGSPERSIEVLAPRVQAIPETIVPNVNGDPLKYQVTYRVYQPASGSGLTLKLKNNVSAYAAA